MAKRKRNLYGFPYDPLQEEDILWEDEYSSGDYDSDEIHSSVASYTTDNELTTDEEDDENKSTVEVNPVDENLLDEAMASGKRVEDADSTDLGDTDSETGEWQK